MSAPWDGSLAGLCCKTTVACCSGSGWRSVVSFRMPLACCSHVHLLAVRPGACYSVRWNPLQQRVRSVVAAGVAQQRPVGCV